MQQNLKTDKNREMLRQIRACYNCTSNNHRVIERLVKSGCWSVTAGITRLNVTKFRMKIKNQCKEESVYQCQVHEKKSTRKREGEFLGSKVDTPCKHKEISRVGCKRLHMRGFECLQPGLPPKYRKRR